MVGAATWDCFGCSVSMSADGKTVAMGADCNGDNGTWSGHARALTYSSTSNEWLQVGDTAVGIAERDFFRSSVSMSTDGKTVAAGANENDDNGSNSGHSPIHLLQTNGCK